MRLFLTIFSLLFVVSSLAKAGSEPSCMSKVSLLQSWQSVTSDQEKCMNKDSDFSKAFGYLCSKDKANLSPQYQKYLSAEATYKAAWEKYRAAKDAGTRALAALDMQNAEQDWSLGGFRAEVDQALNTVNQIHFHCVP